MLTANAMIASLKQQRMTPSEYLEWESQQALRYEYCDGEVFAMAGGTKNHDRIAFNLRRALTDRADRQGCITSGSDVKVMVQQGRFYRYPDLSISCDERDKSHETFHEFPTLIVEVLSSSTEVVDRNQKFQEYREIPTLQEYVLVSAEQMQVECFRRGEGRMWLYFPYKASEIVRIESMGIDLPIEKIYQNIQLTMDEEVEG